MFGLEMLLTDLLHATRSWGYWLAWKVISYCWNLCGFSGMVFTWNLGGCLES